MNVALGIVAAAVLAAGIALAMVRFRRAAGDAPLDEARAAQAATAAIPGFAARRALVGDDRRAALVVGEAGRVALVVGRGERTRALETRWRDIRAAEGGLHVATGERLRATVFLAGVDVLDVRRTGDDGWRRR